MSPNNQILKYCKIYPAPHDFHYKLYGSLYHSNAYRDLKHPNRDTSFYEIFCYDRSFRNMKHHLKLEIRKVVGCLLIVPRRLIYCSSLFVRLSLRKQAYSNILENLPAKYETFQIKF